jgi:hypothetical protein
VLLKNLLMYLMAIFEAIQGEKKHIECFEVIWCTELSLGWDNFIDHWPSLVAVQQHPERKLFICVKV